MKMAIVDIDNLLTKSAYTHLMCINRVEFPEWHKRQNTQTREKKTEPNDNSSFISSPDFDYVRELSIRAVSSVIFICDQLKNAWYSIY